MLNPFQRLVIGLAKYAGFSPVWAGWQQRLLALKGEFRRSFSERVFWYVFEVLSISWGSWILALGVREYVRWGSREWWPIGVMGLGFLSIGLYAIARNGRSYRLEHGVLTVLRHNGQPVWQENLAGLTDITMMRGRGGFVTTLTLRWPGHTRRLELFRSLEAALSAHVK
jgi:hypothetical protein